MYWFLNKQNNAKALKESKGSIALQRSFTLSVEID